MTRISLGNFSNVEGVGSGVFEYKLDFGPARIYFGKNGEALVILLGGGTKGASSGNQRRSRQVAGLQTKEVGEGAMPLTRDFKETIRARVDEIPSSEENCSARESKPCSRAT